MPSITIKEIDLTTAEPISAGTNVVYVPGFAISSASAEEGVPTLCTTIEEFEEQFGSTPFQFKAAQKFPWDSNSVTTAVEEGETTDLVDEFDYDLSYLYAKELLALGLPVLYEAVLKEDSDDFKTANGDELVIAFYAKLTSNSLERLKNKGEYDAKYLTTGAYPSFEVEAECPKKMIVEVRPGTNKDALLTVKNKSQEAKFTVSLGISDESLADGESLSMDGEEPNVALTIIAPSGDTLERVNDEGEGDYVEELKCDDNGNYIIEIALKSPNEIGDYKCYVDAEYDAKPSPKNVAQLLMSVAADRGDAVALIDHINDENRSLLGASSVYHSVSVKNTLANGEYGAMFTPWCNFICGQSANFSVNNNFELPGSFAYLTALAESIKTNASWIAVAGVTRGRLTNLSVENPLCTHEILTNTIAEKYQPRDMVSINPITNIKPYGYTIWGNRTLKRNDIQGDLTATSFLNLRNLVCDVKKEVFAACKQLMFEQNSDILWINFQAKIMPLLDKMKTSYGISNYKIVKVPSTQRGKLEAQVILYPIYAVEDFVVTVVLTDDEVTVE
jgi:hypothetical protein